jgi:microcompartment protein CcmK/EutM
MTRAQAKQVVFDLVAAGYNAEAIRQPDDSYRVTASSKDGPVDVALVAAFTASHGVSAQMGTAELF